jgi:ketosteroid isomerase-like protein
MEPVHAQVETMLRDIYAAFARGDMAGVLEPCTDDVVFHVPGRNPTSGAYTKATFGDLIGKVMQITAGTFQEDVLDVLAGADYGAVVLLHHFQRDNRPVEYRTLHLWKLRSGKFCEWREYPQDLYAFDAAYS